MIELNCKLKLLWKATEKRGGEVTVNTVEGEKCGLKMKILLVFFRFSSFFFSFLLSQPLISFLSCSLLWLTCSLLRPKNKSHSPSKQPAAMAPSQLDSFSLKALFLCFVLVVLSTPPSTPWLFGPFWRANCLKNRWGTALPRVLEISGREADFGVDFLSNFTRYEKCFSRIQTAKVLGTQ